MPLARRAVDDAQCRRRRVVEIAFGIAWACAAAAGFASLETYQARPGEHFVDVDDWPDAVALAPAERKPTLVFFAHPRCPCTTASLGELAVAIARSPSPPDVRFIYFVPHGRRDDPAWNDTELVRSARAMTAVTAVPDEGGTIAAAFGVKTSGHAMLFDADRHLTFSGGLTVNRGHAGASVGRTALIAALREPSAVIDRCPVYGCPLRANMELADGR